MRRPGAVMEDGLVGFPHFYVHALRMTSVGVSVPQRETAAGHVNAYPVVFQEDVAGGLQLDVV